jgi:hypothetical protein
MKFHNFLSNSKVIFNYLKSDLIKKQRSFKIGLITIFLVVFFIALLMNVISVSPIVFLRICEEEAGEADIMMIPSLNKEDMSNQVNAFDRLLYGETKNSTGPGVINIPG